MCVLKITADKVVWAKKNREVCEIEKKAVILGY